MVRHLHDTIPFLLYRVAARMAVFANAEYRGLGLNLFSVRVLVALLLEKTATVGELVVLVSIDQSTLSHILRRLGRRQLVAKNRQAHDNRSVRVTLTAKGRRLAQVCLKSLLRRDRFLTVGLGAAQLRDFKTMLHRLYANVEKLGPGKSFID